MTQFFLVFMFTNLVNFSYFEILRYDFDEPLTIYSSDVKAVFPRCQHQFVPTIRGFGKGNCFYNEPK